MLELQALLREEENDDAPQQQGKDDDLIIKLQWGFVVSLLAIMSSAIMGIAYQLQKMWAAQRKAAQDRQVLHRTRMLSLLVCLCAAVLLLFKFRNAAAGAWSSIGLPWVPRLPSADSPKDGQEQVVMPASEEPQSSTVPESAENHHVGDSPLFSKTHLKRFWAGVLIGILAAIVVGNQGNQNEAQALVRT